MRETGSMTREKHNVPDLDRSRNISVIYVF